MLLSRSDAVLDHFDSGWRKALFLGSLVAFSLATLLAVLSVSRQIGAPSPGFLLWDNLVVPALGSRDWPGNRAGIPFRAVLTEVDGQPVHSAAEVRDLVRAAPLGSEREYTFRHDGRIVRVAVPTSTLRWRDVAPVYLPYVLNGLAFFATGLIVFYFRPRLPAALAALLLGATLGGTLILALDTLSSYWVERLYFLLEALVPGALLHFSLVFPEEKRIAARHPSLAALVYVPFLVLGLLQNLYLASSPERHLAVNDWVYTSIAAAGLVAVGSLLHTYLTSADPIARQQAKVVAAGVALAAFVPSLGLISITVLKMELPMNFLSPFYLVFPLSIAYAIARHNLFDVDRYLRLGVVYAALTAVFLAGYALMLLVVERWSGAERRLPEGAVPLYLLLVLLLLDPLRSRLQRLVDRLFYRQAYSYRATVEATSRALATILQTDRIAAVVLETLTEAMAIEWGAFCVFTGGAGDADIYTRPPQRRAMIGARLVTDAAEVEAIVKKRRLWTRYDRPWGHRESAARSAPLDAALLLPIYFEERPVALVALGERRSGALYSSEDLDLIQTLVNQAALALENAHAYEVIQQTQQELVRAERLAAVGELSAAVAHGIRNPLAGIRAAAQVAREEPEDVATVRENLEDIIGEVDRLEHRVRTLLDFARPFEPTLVAGDLNDHLARFAENVRKRVPPEIDFGVDLAPQLPPVVFDAVQTTEILEALLVNALEAMNGRGRLRLSTSQHTGENAAALEVEDSGPGMDAAQQARIFDLFYTTKSSGTGIGLATVKRLVERQRGQIRVRSEVGRGTTFEIRLPLAERDKGLRG